MATIFLWGLLIYFIYKIFRFFSISQRLYSDQRSTTNHENTQNLRDLFMRGSFSRIKDHAKERASRSSSSKSTQAREKDISKKVVIVEEKRLD